MIGLPGDDEPKNALSTEYAGAVEITKHSLTIRQNIANRIERHQEAIARLRGVEEKLATGSILDVCMDDLQQAMRW